MKSQTAQNLLSLVFAWAILLFASGLHASDPPITGHQDTDLFMTNPNLGGSRPNVLFIIDNSANWNQSGSASATRFQLVKEAFIASVQQFDPAAYNIGVMLMASGSGGYGGMPTHAIQSMTAGSKDDLIAQLCTWASSGGGGGGGKGGGGGSSEPQVCIDLGIAANTTVQLNRSGYAAAMHEAFLYFEGLAPRAGGTASFGSLTSDVDAFTSSAKSQYSPPSDEENPCGNNHIILISNGPPASADTNEMSSMMPWMASNYDMDISEIPLPSGQTNYQGNQMDVYARFFANKRNTYTHTIDVDPGTTGQWPHHAAIMESTAKQGKGNYYKVTSVEELQLAIADALDSIQAIDSVFAASSLPVSVNTRGTHVNEVYMAMFRPDEQGRPRWQGNLKLFEFKLDGLGNLVMADAEGKTAQNPQTGFLAHNSVSFWTYDSNFWEYEERGTPPSPTDSPDGEVVEKGGAAQQHRMRDFPAGRTVYTCTPNCTAGSVPELFSTGNTNLTHSLLGVASTKRNLLINWVRGEDVSDPDNANMPERTAGEARPSLHGDVVHSSPLVINFNRNNTGNDDDLIVFYGANDGQLRAVRGGKSNPDGGRELWSFIPRPFLDRFHWLYDNTPEINTPSVPKSSMANFDKNKPYLFDGNITSYVLGSNGNIDHTTGDKAWIFAGMRRGGRFLVALDVSNPEVPKFMWQRGCANGSCDPGYEGIGQTWSDPQVRRVRIHNTDTGVDENRLVLIVGAGYDAEAEDPYPQEAVTQGQGLMMIDATTGEVIWRVGPSVMPASVPAHVHAGGIPGLDYSIPAPVVALNKDGVVYRMYAPDTGGNIWRIDLVDSSGQLETDPDNWHVHKFASLGGNGIDTRKFLHRVDVAASKNAAGQNFHAIIIGSGDREKPFETAVQNRFYVLHDYELTGQASVATLTEADLFNATNELQPNDAHLAGKKGCYINLRPGEKVVGRAETRAGMAFFGTNQPAEMVVSDSCVSDLGVARSYEVTLNCGAVEGRITRDTQLGPNVGFPPPYIHVVVEVADPDGEDGDTITTEGVTSGPDTRRLPADAVGQRLRQFWYMEFDE